jgi:DNA repair protein RadA/Sms
MRLSPAEANGCLSWVLPPPIATWQACCQAVGGVARERGGPPCAAVSVAHHRPIPAKACLREIGLAGEVRPAVRGQERLREAAKLGFEKAIVPKANLPKAKIPGLETLAVERIDQAVRLLREL